MSCMHIFFSYYCITEGQMFLLLGVTWRDRPWLWPMVTRFIFFTRNIPILIILSQWYTSITIHSVMSTSGFPNRDWKFISPQSVEVTWPVAGHELTVCSLSKVLSFRYLKTSQTFTLEIVYVIYSRE